MSIRLNSKRRGRGRVGPARGIFRSRRQRRDAARLAAAHAALGLVLGLCFWWAASGHRATALADAVGAQSTAALAVPSEEPPAERSLTPDRILGRRLGLGEAPPGRSPLRSPALPQPSPSWDQAAEVSLSGPRALPAVARPTFFGPPLAAADSVAKLMPVPALNGKPMTSVPAHLLSGAIAPAGSAGPATNAWDLMNLSSPAAGDWLD